MLSRRRRTEPPCPAGIMTYLIESVGEVNGRDEALLGALAQIIERKLRDRMSPGERFVIEPWHVPAAIGRPNSLNNSDWGRIIELIWQPAWAYLNVNYPTTVFEVTPHLPVGGGSGDTYLRLIIVRLKPGMPLVTTPPMMPRL